MKLAQVAQAAVPGEEVLAAGIFRTGGSLTARMSGFGELSVRRQERRERDSSGLPFKRYMLLVVTPTRLHLFDARSAMTRWKARRSLAVWSRSDVRATMDPKPMSTRLTLDIVSESRRIELEAPKARRGTAGEVADMLAKDTAGARAHGEVALATRRLPPSAEPEEAERMRKLHSRTGWIALAGGATRLAAYAMPWIVVMAAARPDEPFDISGYRELGSPVFSIGISIVIIVAAAFYLAGRREASPRLLQSIGIGSVVVFAIQFQSTLNSISALRLALQGRGVIASVSVGFGVWVELAGVILTLAGGLYAVKLSKRGSPQRGFRTAGIPEERVSGTAGQDPPPIPPPPPMPVGPPGRRGGGGSGD